MVGSGHRHEFSALTVVDLLEARDAYHHHLMHLENVMGTAVGRYLIRKSDPDNLDPSKAPSGPLDRVRTLTNAAIRDWSQPCVLVFVDKWPKLEDISRSPENFVPPRLYLPDDRVIPTCVICARGEPLESRPISDLDLNKDILGGGYPVLSDVQGQTRVGSIGCLVTDNHTVFALTNRHVAGPRGQTSFIVYRKERYRLGESVEPSLRTLPFTEAYPDWPGYKTQLNLDAGLIRLDNVNDWTAQVYGIGPIGQLLDIHTQSLSLDFVDRDVRAFGGASGPLSGSICGLFYRYRSLAGEDYVTDFLIGPTDGAASVTTRHGDSGTIWFLDSDDTASGHRPIAMQWGAAAFSDGTGEEDVQFALASNLTTILRRLDVQIIRDWNAGLPEVWGKLGHYQVGAKACDLVSAPKLYQLMQNNKDLIGLSDDDRRNKRFPKQGQTAFIALADVSDLYWKMSSVRGSKEKPSHFADMDEQGKGEFAGKTLMDLYNEDPDSLTPETWLRFYQSLETKPRYQGSLPFRVKQFYEEMVGFVRERKIPEFVAAAGILAHYVGDAAQPLHTSRLHHGHNQAESGVHSQYETAMIQRFRAEIIARINDALDGREIASNFHGRQRAAEVTVELTRYVRDRLSPEDIIQSYNEARGSGDTNRSMWQDLGEATIDCLIEGTLYLAEIWESAWLEGGGNNIAWARMGTVSKNKLRSIYRKKSFVKSKWLEGM